MIKNKKVLCNSFLYMASNILLKACNFFLIPIYTHFLSPNSYGIISIINSFASVTIYLIVFSLFSSVFRFYADIKNNHEKVKMYISTICTFCLGTNIFFLVLCFCNKNIISKTFFSGLHFFPIVALALVYTSTNSIYILYQDILKSMQLAKKSVITSILYFLIQFILCIVLVAILKLEALGTIIAYVITQLIFCIWAFIDLNKMDIYFVHINSEILIESLKYSIPIIPHNLSTTIAQYVSKLFISGSFSLSTVGIFNLSQQFGLIADTVQSSVSSAFQPWLYEQLNENKHESKKNINDLTIVLTWIYCFIFIMLGFFSKEVIEVIAAKEYLMAWKIVPLIVLTYAIKIPYYFYVTILFYYKNMTNKVFLITLSTSILNIILSAKLIPMWSMTGSVFADLISMSIRVALVIIFSKKYDNTIFKLRSIIGRLAYSMLIMGIFLFPSYLNIEFINEILFKIIGIIVFIMGILIVERKNIKDIKLIISIVKKGK